MKIRLVALIVLALSLNLRAATLYVSTLDSALQSARDAASTPWSTSAQSQADWKKFASKNVPILHEHKGPLMRDLYIPNPGLGYWVLSALTKEKLFEINEAKLAIGDTLISANEYKDVNGETRYWALWAPHDRAHLLTDQMKKFGIGQARIEFSFWDRLSLLAKVLPSWVVLLSLGMNVLLFFVCLILGAKILIRK